MAPNDFVDYYELLQLSPNADEGTIHRVFRHLAKQYHPDQSESGDPDKFRLLLEAHRTLTNAEARAGYDVKHQEHWNRRWKLAAEASNGGAFSEDRIIRERLLSLLYVQRRRDMRSPGLGEYEMARLVRVPVELVEFHLWYLREKGWIQRQESGQMAISAAGVDEIERGELRLSHDHLLAAHAAPAESAQPAAAEVKGSIEERSQRRPGESGAWRIPGR